MFTTISARMGPNEDNLNTYFLFMKVGKGIKQIVGPIFGNEIQQAKQKFFPQNGKVHIMLEPSFAGKYRDKYRAHVQQFWMDKLFTYFTLNLDWVGPVTLFSEEKGFQSNWFTLSHVTVNDTTQLLLNFSVTVNPFYVPRLLLEIQGNVHLPVIPGYHYHNGTDGFMYTGHRAVARSLSETLIKTMSRN